MPASSLKSHLSAPPIYDRDVRHNIAAKRLIIYKKLVVIISKSIMLLQVLKALRVTAFHGITVNDPSVDSLLKSSDLLLVCLIRYKGGPCCEQEHDQDKTADRYYKVLGYGTCFLCFKTMFHDCYLL